MYGEKIHTEASGPAPAFTPIQKMIHESHHQPRRARESSPVGIDDVMNATGISRWHLTVSIMCTGAIAPEAFVSYDVHEQCQQK